MERRPHDRDNVVARRYLELWQELAGDPVAKETRKWNGAETPLPKEPSGVDLVFSPRSGLAALKWYAKLMDQAKESVFLTAAFGVSQELAEIFAERRITCATSCSTSAKAT